jgi:hypothetical protein
MLGVMNALKAHVLNGRIVVDEPVDLPDGTELDVFLYDTEGDDLDDDERAALHAALDEGIADADAGRVVEASVVLAELKARSSS